MKIPYNAKSAKSQTFDGNDITTYYVYDAKPGLYKIECWGASGNGKVGVLGGRGGYAAGFIKLPQITLFVYPGGKGNGPESSTAAFNGGGLSQYGGGGGSDVRLIEGKWDNFSSLKSRIIVAGGGGGGDANEEFGDFGGNAGGLVGFGSNLGQATGGTQTSGGKGGISGKFGKGAGNGLSGENDGNGAGGSGYFGGGDSTQLSVFGGGGGSSFISGYDGCNAINDTLSTDEDNIVMTNQSIHYSNLRFFMMDMIDGNSLMPSPNGGTETGHIGYGAVRITPYKQIAISCFLYPLQINKIYFLFVPLFS